MAEKGFDLKVLIPTDDGIQISPYGIENAAYYLMYNLSNRSYQIAGKSKTKDYFGSKLFDPEMFKDFCIKNDIDKVIKANETVENEIGNILNELIDIIDKKTS